VHHVALAGGVFMNRIVLAGVRAGLESAGLVPLVHRDLPMNDGDVSYGQTVVAWALRDTV
jgi:hydrogenase maturation protein HypF